MLFFCCLLLKALVLFLCIALGVGFYTLLERKVLAYIQLRKGPNKVGYFGIPQPLADAVKLFTKEVVFVSFSNKFFYVFSPVVSVIIMLTLWGLYFSEFGVGVFKLGVLFFLCVSSVNVYTVLFSGWSSNSKYALLGAVRAVAQTISYEVSMALVLMVVLIRRVRFDLVSIGFSQVGIWFIFLMFPVFVIWFISSLAETNRAPFDLAEGESELVSGFNIEYGGGEFAFLFIAEYGRILFMSFMRVVLFIGNVISFVGWVVVVKFLLLAYGFL